MLAKDVLIPARSEELLDDFGVKWPDLFLLAFLADGIREMFALRPDLLLTPDGSMGANDFYAPTAGAARVRIANGRLQLWDSVLLQWIAVEFQDGALAALDPSEGESVPAWDDERGDRVDEAGGYSSEYLAGSNQHSDYNRAAPVLDTTRSSREFLATRLGAFPAPDDPTPIALWPRASLQGVQGAPRGTVAAK